MKSEELEESALRIELNSSKRLNEASILIETSLSLLRIKRCTLKTEHRMKKSYEKATRRIKIISEITARTTKVE